VDSTISRTDIDNVNGHVGEQGGQSSVKTLGDAKRVELLLPHAVGTLRPAIWNLSPSMAIRP